MDIKVTLDVRDAQAKLSAFQKNQLPYALQLAINDVAFQVMRDENARIGRLFKHPRPFTQRATQVQKRASKADPTAIVSVRPDQAKYLKPYEFGGVHVLPGKALLNPKDIGLDQFGQLRKNQIKALLARPDVFAGTVHGITGIWQRPKTGQRPHGKVGTVGSQKGLRLLVRLGNALPVHQHLHWLDNAQALLAAQWPATFDAAMKKAVAGAKL